jgi:hypothetical protein
MYLSWNSIIETQIFSPTMPSDRYFQILKYLHFCDNENADLDDRLYNIRVVLDSLVGKFKTSYVPRQHIASDEYLLKFNESPKFRQEQHQDTFGI